MSPPQGWEAFTAHYTYDLEYWVIRKTEGCINLRRSVILQERVWGGGVRTEKDRHGERKGVTDTMSKAGIVEPGIQLSDLFWFVDVHTLYTYPWTECKYCAQTGSHTPTEVLHSFGLWGFAQDCVYWCFVAELKCVTIYFLWLSPVVATGHLFIF